VRVTLGAVAVGVGVLKFFLRAPVDEVLVVGDLLPAIVGIAVGLALLAEYWTAAGVEQNATQQRVAKITSLYRLPLSIVAIATAVVHFLVPGTVIL
jgi:hypothetical protein